MPTPTRSSGTQRASKAPKPEDRVKHIKRMMVSGEWREGVSDHELGELWGIDPSTVRHSSAEASRALRSAVEDQGLAARLVSILLDNVHEAKMAARYEAVAKSVEVAAKILGFNGEKREEAEAGPLEVRVFLGDRPLDTDDASG